MSNFSYDHELWEKEWDQAKNILSLSESTETKEKVVKSLSKQGRKRHHEPYVVASSKRQPSLKVTPCITPANAPIDPMYSFPDLRLLSRSQNLTRRGMQALIYHLLEIFQNAVLLCWKVLPF